MAGRKIIFRQGQGDRGATVVLIALLLPLLIGLLGLAVDFGMLFMHHSRLQHAADAMALAGVRAGVSGKTAQLLSLSEVTKTEEGGISFRKDGREYKLASKTQKTDEDKLASKTQKTDEDDKASLLQDSDTSSLDEANGVTFDSSLFSGDGAKAYKVTLTEENFETSFLKVFGVNEYLVEVQALAVVVPGSLKEDVLKTVVNIFNNSPNYYWETLGLGTDSMVSYTRYATFQMTYLEIDEKDPEKVIISPKTEKTVYAHSLSNFNADTGTRRNFLEAIPYLKTTQGKLIASYKDRESAEGEVPIHEVGEEYKFCAAPIMATIDPKGKKSKNEQEVINSCKNLYAILWRLDSKLIKTFLDLAAAGSPRNPSTSDTTGTLKAMYVDRPNKDASAKWKATIPDSNNNESISSARIRATVLDITADSLGNRVASPLYVRFESEPVAIGTSVTVVQPITINVTGKNPTPLIIAYEGPSRLRGQARVKVPGTNNDSDIMADVPYVNQYKPQELQAPQVQYFDIDSETGRSTLKMENYHLRLTSVTESPPVTINLDHDFRGVIYIPFSKAIIKGSGKIEGFILAHEVEFEDNSESGRTQETLKNFVLPVLMPEKVEKTGHAWNYTTKLDPPRDYCVVYNTFSTFSTGS